MVKFPGIVISEPLSAVMAAVLLVSGCSSGVSQESYNSVVEENSKLQGEKFSLESEKSSLESEIKALKSENDELREENSKLQEKSKDNTQTIITDKHNDNFKYDVFTTADDAKQFIDDKTGNKWHCRMGAFVSYIEENNYEIIDFPRECYIDGMWNKDNVEEWLTEIQVPVKKKK